MDANQTASGEFARKPDLFYAEVTEDLKLECE
jgi:hypothetical protein